MKYLSHTAYFTKVVGTSLIVLLIWWGMWSFIGIVVAIGAFCKYAFGAPAIAVKAWYDFASCGVPFRRTWQERFSAEGPLVSWDDVRYIVVECTGNAVDAAREDWQQYLARYRAGA